MIKKENRKAEITSGQFVTIVIVLIGFGILLFLFYQLMWTGRVDKDTCMQSVVTRASFPSALNINKYIPLKCKTQKYCVTPDFLGDCEEDFSGLKDVSRVSVDNEQEVEKFLAGEIVDCWSMMGEGKVQLFSDYYATNFAFGKVYPSCVICSRIAFDKSAFKDMNQEEKEKYLNIDVINYMRTHKVPNKEISYLDYLSEGKAPVYTIQDTKGDYVAQPQPVDVFVAKDGKLDNLDDLTKETIAVIPTERVKDSTDELAIVFMQISAPTGGSVLKNSFSMLGKFWIGSFVVAPMTTVSTTLKVGSSLNPVSAAIIAGVMGIAVAGQQINAAANRGITAGYCGQVTVGDQARDGCSIVTLTNYNVDSIKKYCQVIESIA